jgi:hypothetical protein
MPQTAMAPVMTNAVTSKEFLNTRLPSNHLFAVIQHLQIGS